MSYKIVDSRVLPRETLQAMGAADVAYLGRPPGMQMNSTYSYRSTRRITKHKMGTFAIRAFKKLATQQRRVGRRRNPAAQTKVIHPNPSVGCCAKQKSLDSKTIPLA